MKTQSSSLLAMFFAASAAYGQNISPTYQYNLPGKFENWEVAPGGMLLVGTKAGFTGVDAHKKDATYTYTELGKIKPEEMDLIPGYPWVVLHQAGFSPGKNKKVVFDYTTGKVIFDSEKHGWTAPSGYKFLPDQGAIALWGYHQKSNSALAFYNIDENKELDYYDIGDKNAYGGMAYFQYIKYVENYMIIPTKNSFVCVDLLTGKPFFVWKDKDGASNVFEFFFDEKNEYAYAYNRSLKASLHKIDIRTGKSVWKKPISVKGGIKEIIERKEGLWVYSEEESSFEVNIYNTETATPLWKKSYSSKGGIRVKRIIDNGVLFGTSLGELNILTWDGTTTLKKPVKVGTGHWVFDVDENGKLFYINPLNMGVVNIKDGSFAQAPTKFKKVEKMRVLWDENNARYIVSTGNELFFIKTNGEVTKVRDIKFKGDELPDKIELRSEGFILSSAQNVLMIDYNGNELYSLFFKAPGTSVGGKILAGAVMAASTAAAAGSAASAGMQSSPTGYKSDAQRRAEGNAQSASNVAGSASAAFNQRFKASAATRDHLYILTQLDEGVGLVRINKDTGKKDGEIVLKDKKPNYTIDEDFGAFYYLKSDTEIVGYDLR